MLLQLDRVLTALPCAFVCVSEHREANATAGCHSPDAVRRRAATHQVHQHERADGRPHEGVQGPAGDEYVERTGEGHVQRKVSKSRTASQYHEPADLNWWSQNLTFYFLIISGEPHLLHNIEIHLTKIFFFL